MASNYGIAVPFTGTTAQNPTKPHEGVSGRDSLIAVAAMQMPATKSQHPPLPTPPNSISPNLPPRSVKAARGKSLEPLDSDLDLEEGAPESLVSLSRDAFAAQSLETDNTSFEIAGNITPALLAKHHLPEILLNNGPLAIRHVMGFLTTSVPGFSGIPPAKARRLVVGALEGRGSNGEGGGMNGEVQFEKVGWGRWDARLKGQAPRKPRDYHQKSLSPSPSLSSSFSGTSGVPIRGHAPSYTRTRLSNTTSSWADGSDAVFSHDSDDDVLTLADNMSLDGDETTRTEEDDPIPDDDPNELTDEEDWAAIGAAALRKSSFTPLQNQYLDRHFQQQCSKPPVYNKNQFPPSSSTLAKSAPLFVHRSRNHMNINEVMSKKPGLGSAGGGSGNIEFSNGVVGDLQEREAIEALLKLGSV